MPDDLPIACTLNATDFRAREALMAELGRDALIDTLQAASHARLRFAAGCGVRERIEAFVAGEQTCCAFLTMTITTAPDEVWLSIDAPPDAVTVLAEMVTAFGRADRQVA